MQLKAIDLTKEFIRESKNTNRFTAVDDITLTLNGGELTVLMGRSGSGKTTLLNMLSGLLLPTGGKVMLDDKDIYTLPDRELSRLRNKSFGVIPQGQTAIQSLSTLENILLPIKLYGKVSDDDNKAALKLMQRLDIAHLSAARPAELSGGELRRMAIARAVIKTPDIIFADEPTGDLDDENTEEVLSFLKEYAASGKCVFVVTHENDAKDFADRLLTMSKGKIE